jgi:hypothetical protein
VDIDETSVPESAEDARIRGAMGKLTGIREGNQLEPAILRVRLAAVRLKAVEYEIRNSVETLVLRSETLM